MNKYLKILLLGVLAGGAIALGGLGNLCCILAGQKILGSFVFSFGLLTVCGASLFLFTGKIGYAFHKDGPRPLDLLFGYIGNLIGAAVLGLLIFAITKNNEASVYGIAKNIAHSRDIIGGGEKWYEALLLSVLCGMLVFIAVDMFKRKPGPIGILCLIGAVAIFVAAGFEHCIANMFYYSLTNKWSYGLVLNIFITTIGNSIGALLIYFLTHFALDK